MSPLAIVLSSVGGYIVVAVLLYAPLEDELRTGGSTDSEFSAGWVSVFWLVALPIYVLVRLAKAGPFAKGPTRALRERRERQDREREQKEYELRMREARVRRLERELGVNIELH